ncbi:MAG: tetratricopeptide repeat protein [Alphaproteobacteria bacterium]|nr:tetratricopeptide repeat protein [Alphaproteobacteria bacterium]
MSRAKTTPPYPAIDPAILAETQSLYAEAEALMRNGQSEKALPLYQAVLLHNPFNAPAWSNMGLILRESKKHEAALICACRALELDPENPVLLSNHAGALVSLDRNEEALKSSRVAVEKAPDHPQIRIQHAIVLRETGLAAEAQAHFDIALEMMPDAPNLRWERAINLLILGRFAEGWPAFEDRWNIGKITPHVYDGVPRWRGEDVSGKTVLVYEEQGYGDTMLCARYLPLLKERGARVIFEVTPPLRRLMEGLPGMDRVIARGAPAGETCDYNVPVMSLPGLFGTEASSIPPPLEIFTRASPPPEAERLLSLGAGRLKVGILWSGRANFAQNHKRSVALKRFLPLAEIPGVQLYSLQKGPGEEQLAGRGLRGVIHDLGAQVGDFTDTATIVRDLDLIVMTDSGLAHLAGSMGRPVWNLLCHRPYWLYGSGGEDCPWYPSMRLFRQQTPGDWDGVFARVAAALSRLASSS